MDEPTSGYDGLKTSPLHDRHVALGAKSAEFGGWSMPLEYKGGGAVKEHRAVRESVGVFDVSHLGKVVVHGPGAAEFVNRCLTNDLGRIAPGQAQYTLCCAPDGGVVDDLIAYLRSPDEVLLIPNAANTAEVARRLSGAAPAGVEVVNRHGDFAVIAVQGPDSDQVLTAAGLPVGHDYMSFVEVEHGGSPVVVCRTGYTGERGYELVVLREAAGGVWDALFGLGTAESGGAGGGSSVGSDDAADDGAAAAGEERAVVPAGLAARDTLRTEMGYPLHGQDISPSITPVQARLGWAVGWDKPEFWGHEALRAERAAKPSRLLRGLVASGRGIPRPGMSVYVDEQTAVGAVTSGTFSPTRRVGVGLALLDRAVTDGSEVTVDVRGRREPFVVTKPPFVTPGSSVS